MANKKVYDLAKEFGVASKEFAQMLLEVVDIPVKNHMSVITEQQEKYFRNNFTVSDGKIIAKSASGAASEEHKEKSEPTEKAPAKPNKEKSASQTSAAKRAPKKEEAPKPAEPAAEIVTPVESAPAEPTDEAKPAESEAPAVPETGTNRPPRNFSKIFQGEVGEIRPPEPQQRDNRPRGDNRNSSRSGAQGGYNRDRNAGSGGAKGNTGGYNRDRNSGSTGYNRSGSGNTGSSRPGGGYQQRRDSGSNPQQRSGSTGGYNRDRGNFQGSGTYDKDRVQSNTGDKRYTPARKPAGTTQSDGVAKPKIDKNKKESKQKNEQRSKARESFFNDEKPTTRGIDNTKKIKGNKGEYKKKKLAVREERLTGGIDEVVVIPESIMISELAEKILIRPTEIIKILMGYGMMLSITQSIDFETASIVCEELGIEIRLEEDEDIFENILNTHYADEEQLKTRPPIITVMGHVDHGKTSLLDAIRNTNVIAGEAGGITQHIGAYTISLRGQAITFIDTPGHEAFTAMRSRGASVTDIAVLVVAADDGIMPQTVEAINHAKAAEVPIVVAINKIDKVGANIDRVKQGLTEYGLVSEDWGGDTICVPVSAKTGEGLTDLLDSILLVAEVEDLKANFDLHAIGTIIEARIDKQRGVTATLLIKSGKLHDGDIIVAGMIYGRVRAMSDDKGKRIIEAGPSRAVEIIGLDEVPEAGEKFFVSETEKDAKKITDSRRDRARLVANKAAAPVSLDDIFEQISQGELKEIQLIVKTDVSGSFEAIKQSLEKLTDTENGIAVKVIHGGAGAVSESDVTLAAASNALIIAFNVRPDAKAKEAAIREGVEIRSYNVIYNILEEVEAAMKGMLAPEFKEVVTGTVEVRQLFKIPSAGTVAGGYVTGGTVSRKDRVRVIRNGIVIYDGEISSLRRFKDDVREVATGYECGISIEKYNDIKEGDILEFYHMEEIPRD